VVLKWLKNIWYRIQVGLRSAPFFNRVRSGERIFFPGCSLSAGLPDVTLGVFEDLKKKNLVDDMWLICCGMPLNKFISSKAAAPHDRKLNHLFRKKGVKEIITACGNCFVSLEKHSHSSSGVKITSLYETLSQTELQKKVDTEYARVHHPCPARTNTLFRQSFEKFAKARGIASPVETKHALACCLVHTEKQKKRIAALKHHPMVTYCGHCVHQLEKDVPIRHCLQDFYPQNDHIKRQSVTKAFSYINRKLSS